MAVTYIYDKETTKLEKLDGKLELGRKTSDNSYLPTNLIRNVDHADVDFEHFGDDSDVTLGVLSAPAALSAFLGFVAIATVILVFGGGGRVLPLAAAPLVDVSVFGAPKHRGQFLGPEHDVADRPDLK